MRLMQMRKLRGERRCLMALRLIPMMGYEVCVERMPGRRWKSDGTHKYVKLCFFGNTTDFPPEHNSAQLAGTPLQDKPTRRCHSPSPPFFTYVARTRSARRSPPPPHRHDDKVWGSTCAQAKKSQATSAHSALTDEDGIFRDVLSIKE